MKSLLAWFSYLNSRFPLHINVPATALLSGATILVSLNLQDIAPYFSWKWPAAQIWVILMFYQFRVLDDIKDREKDAIAHPSRALSTGALSYRFLLTSGAISAIIGLVLAISISLLFFFLAVVVLLFSLVMFKDFFIGTWLKKYPFAYAVAHLLVLIILDFTLLQTPSDAGEILHTPALILFAFISFFMTFSLEVARKIRLPEFEHPDADSYSKLIGVRGSLFLVSGLQAVTLVLTFLIGNTLGLQYWFWIVTGAAWLIVLVGTQLAYKSLTDRSSRKLDKAASLYYVAYEVSLIVHLVIGVASEYA